MNVRQYSFLFSLVVIFLMSGCKKDDPCENVVCQNGGSCNDGTCSCAAGYEGTTCGTEVRAKFIGIFEGTFSCPGTNTTVAITNTNSAAGISSIVMGDGADTWIGTVNGSSVNIATQTISGSTSISGSGQLSGLILTLSLNLNGTTCTFTGTKQ